MAVGDLVIKLIIYGREFALDLALIIGSYCASYVDWFFSHSLFIKNF